MANSIYLSVIRTNSVPLLPHRTIYTLFDKKWMNVCVTHHRKLYSKRQQKNKKTMGKKRNEMKIDIYIYLGIDTIPTIKLFSNVISIWAYAVRSEGTFNGISFPLAHVDVHGVRFGERSLHVRGKCSVRMKPIVSVAFCALKRTLRNSCLVYDSYSCLRQAREIERERERVGEWDHFSLTFCYYREDVFDTVSTIFPCGKIFSCVPSLRECSSASFIFVFDWFFFLLHSIPINENS